MAEPDVTETEPGQAVSVLLRPDQVVVDAARLRRLLRRIRSADAVVEMARTSTVPFGRNTAYWAAMDEERDAKAALLPGDLDDDPPASLLS